MDRNTFTGLFLILIILVGSTFLLKPSPEEIKQKATQDSIAVLKSKGLNTQSPIKNQEITVQQIIKDSALVIKNVSETFTVLENNKLKVTLSSLGGKIASVEIKNQTSYLGKPVILFNNQDTKLGFSFTADGKNINTETLVFNKIDNAKDKATLRSQNADGTFIDYVYTLPADSFKVNFNVKLNGYDTKIQLNTNLILNWETRLLQQEKDITNERRYSGTFYKMLDGEVNSLSESKDDQKTIEEGKVNWVAYKQHYFSATLLSNQGFNNANLEIKTIATGDTSALKIYKASLNIPFKTQSNYAMQFVFAPNKFDVLNAQNIGLENIIDMGWPPLKWVNRYGVMQLFKLLNTTGLSIGIIILILTVLLKLVIFPFTYKSYVSMAKMRVLKPEMDEIKKRVGEDNQALVQQEYLKLYKKVGVNPLGGCLPLLFQMPFIIAFFYFFPGLFELRHESFLWMKDLSTYDQVITFPTIPLLGWNHISLMCLLMTISTLIYTYFNNQVSGATGQMKYIGYITPLIFFGVLNSYAAGLNLYYFFANVITFTQQYFIRQFVNDDKIHAQLQENKKKPEDPNKKKSGFQKKLEDMMRQQEQIKQQKKK
jgi:YidC/Oxa1 family membrane protein insertase